MVHKMAVCVAGAIEATTYKPTLNDNTSYTPHIQTKPQLRMTACYKLGDFTDKLEEAQKIKALGGLCKTQHKMKVRFFKHGVGNSWELNFIGTTYNLRIARHQIAFWKNYNPIINWSC